MFSAFANIDSERTFQKWFKEGKTIGKGSFGNVIQVVNRNNGNVIAAMTRLAVSKTNSKTSDQFLGKVNKKVTFCLQNI